MAKYMSELYRDVSNEDIKQTIEYKYLKAYPSVNSTNGSPIHSESNVRWLTKQFTKKPFIIPRDGNPEEDMFKYGDGNSSMNGTYVAGGIADIDGYIISIANDIDKVLFDYRGNTEFGSDSLGVIWTQVVQRTMIDITQQLQDSDLKKYISVIKDEIEAEGGDWSAVTADDIKRIANVFYENLIGDATTEEPKLGEVTIEYRNIDNIKIIQYIDSLPEEEQAKFTKEQEGSSYYYTGKYDVKLGFPQTYYTIEDKTIPFIYIVDNFGFIYTFYNALDDTANRSVLTHYYPATREERIDMQHIHEGLSVNDSSTEAENIINTMIPDSKIYNINDCYSNSNVRDNTLPSQTDLNSVLNNFSNVPLSSLMSTYCTLSGETLASITSLPKHDLAFGIADNYYCLPTDSTKPQGDTYYKVLSYLSVPILQNQTTNLPITILNNAGMLTPKNIQFYKNDNTYIVAEGYLTFMRRISALLIQVNDSQSIDGEHTFNPDYYNNPNGDEVEGTDWTAYRRCWADIFKYFEVNGIIGAPNIITTMLNDPNVFNGDVSALHNFFGAVEDSTDINNPYKGIKFHHIYNTFISPYLNIYMQIAWTAMFENGVIDEKYCPAKCLTSLRNMGKQINDDEYWMGKIALTHTYHLGTGDTHNITSSYNFTENADMYTDGSRLRTYLCEQEEVPFITKTVDDTEEQPDINIDVDTTTEMEE